MVDPEDTLSPGKGNIEALLKRNIALRPEHLSMRKDLTIAIKPHRSMMIQLVTLEDFKRYTDVHDNLVI